MNENDLIRFKHMLEAAKAARTFADGKTRESLESDLQLVFALVKAIEIIGEAGSKLSADTRKHTHRFLGRKLLGCVISLYTITLMLI